MDNNRYKFSVQMTTKEVFRFSFHHSYFRISGFLGILFSLAALGMLIRSYSILDDRNRAVLLIVALWFIVIEPLTLLSRARSQAKKNPTYKKPLNYELSEAGVTVSQDDQSQSIEWQYLQKIVETKTQYLVYSSRVHAFVFPKSAIGDNCDLVEQLIVKYTEGTHVKVPAKMKKRVLKKVEV